MMKMVTPTLFLASEEDREPWVRNWTSDVAEAVAFIRGGDRVAVPASAIAGAVLMELGVTESKAAFLIDPVRSMNRRVPGRDASDIMVGLNE